MISWGTTIAIGFAGCCGGNSNEVHNEDDDNIPTDEEDYIESVAIHRRRSSSIADIAAEVQATKTAPADDANALPPLIMPDAQVMKMQN